jgi:hypothetical protein
VKDVQFTGLDPAAFGAALGVTGQAGVIDMAKVNAAVGAALANGRVAVPEGNAALTIAAGTIKLGHVKLQAKGGPELSLNGVIDLSGAAIDALLTLSEPPPAMALIRTRPEISVAVKGPLAAPKRTLDISALTSWLTLNGAELQTRRIESIEANRRVAPAGSDVHAMSPDPQLAPRGTVVETAIPPSLFAAPSTGGGGLERLPQPLAPSVVPDQTHPGSGDLGNNPTTASVPPSAPTPKPAQQAPNPPSAGSILDFLFRKQN